MNTNSQQPQKWNTQQQLDRMLEAMAYVISQRQMRGRWATAGRSGRLVRHRGSVLAAG